MTNHESVKCFHLRFGAPISPRPTMLDTQARMRRLALIGEEYRELTEALGAEDLVEAADAIADLLYVVYGTAVEMGLPADKLVSEVHRSNMTKLGEDGKPILRSDGKILKGPNYEPPDIRGVLNG